jgi:sodium-dependent dicarboxylate transporter 2/3/5
MLTFGYISVVFSTFMSNTAAAAILIPLSNALMPGHMLELSLVVALSSSIATGLPVSSPANAVAYATGYLKSNDFVLVGAFVALIAPALITAFIYFLV